MCVLPCRAVPCLCRAVLCTQVWCGSQQDQGRLQRPQRDIDTGARLTQQDRTHISHTHTATSVALTLSVYTLCMFHTCRGPPCVACHASLPAHKKPPPPLSMLPLSHASSPVFCSLVASCLPAPPPPPPPYTHRCMQPTPPTSPAGWSWTCTPSLPSLASLTTPSACMPSWWDSRRVERTSSRQPGCSGRPPNPRVDAGP